MYMFSRRTCYFLSISKLSPNNLSSLITLYNYDKCYHLLTISSLRSLFSFWENQIFASFASLRTCAWASVQPNKNKNLLKMKLKDCFSLLIDPPYSSTVWLKLWIYIQMDCYSKWAIPLLISLLQILQPIVEQNSWFWSLKKTALGGEYILWNTLITLFPSLCKTPTNNSWKGRKPPSYCNISVSSNSNSLLMPH